MTVIKEYNTGTGQWETVVVGKQGPPGVAGNGTAYYGQISSQTTQTVSIVTQGAYVPMAITGTFDTASSFGTVAPTTATFGVKNDSGSTQLFTVIATADVEIGNNKTAGFRMAVNGVAVAETTCTATTGTQNFAKLLSQWMVELDDGDEVSLLVANLTDTDDIDVDRAKVVVFTAGRQGVQGVQGPAGQGVPVGGTTGQMLAKASNADYDTAWIGQTSGSPISIEAWTTPTASTNFDGFQAGTSFRTYALKTTSTQPDPALPFDGSVTYRLALAAGTYEVELVHQKTSFGADFTLTLGGVVIGVIPGYSSPTQNNQYAILSGVSVTATGLYDLVISNPTKNAASSGYYLGIQAITVRRTA